MPRCRGSPRRGSRSHLPCGQPDPARDRSPAAAIYDCRFPARKGGSRTFGTKVHYSLALKSATVKGAKDPGAWRCLTLPEKRLAARAVVRPSATKSRRSGRAPPTFNRGFGWAGARRAAGRPLPPAFGALAHCARPSLSPIALIHRAGASRWPASSATLRARPPPPARRCNCRAGVRAKSLQ